MDHHAKLQSVNEALCNIDGVWVELGCRNVERVIGVASHFGCNLATRESLLITIEVSTDDEQAEHIAHRRAIDEERLSICDFSFQ